MGLHEKLEIAERQADARAADLIEEFQTHYLEYVALHPGDKGRKREIFEAWSIQKIAGLQLAVTELAERLNAAAGTNGANSAN